MISVYIIVYQTNYVVMGGFVFIVNLKIKIHYANWSNYLYPVLNFENIRNIEK